MTYTVKAMSSDPILQKQMQAYYTASQMSRGMLESIEEYNKRIQKYHEEYAKRQKEANTKALQEKILGVDAKMTANAENITKNINSIESLKRLYFGMNDNYDHSLDPIISQIRQRQTLLENTLYELKKGQQEGNNLNLREQNAFDFPSAATKAHGMFDNDIMATGQRNILG